VQFRELDVVRVVKLLAPERGVTSSFDPAPQPAVGDEGTVVSVARRRYMVENVDGDGYTLWLADFAAEELELIAQAG
jgi:hypothetical protein